MKNKSTLTAHEQKALKAILLDNLIDALTTKEYAPLQQLMDIGRFYDLDKTEYKKLLDMFK